MDRSKLVKLVVAGVIGLAAVVVLAINVWGGGGRPKPVDNSATSAPAREVRGGPASAPEGPRRRGG